MKPTVGFIGLGLMGILMAMNILKKGYPLVVYNRTPGKSDELQKSGAQISTSPSELAKRADIVITMVTAARDVEAVLFGEEGVTQVDTKGQIIIDMSTIGPSAAKKIGKKLESSGREFLDAPVTGSTPKAKTGELTIFIGGKEEVYKKAESVLRTMGTNLQYMGQTGSGQAIKLINNYLIAASVISLAEGILLAKSMGLSLERVGEVLPTVPAMSGFMNLKLPNFLKDEYPLLFSTANMKKDISLAYEEAETGKLTLDMLAYVKDLYERAINEGLSEEDMSSVMKLIQK